MSSSPDQLTRQRALHRLGADLCGRYTLSRLIGIGGMAAVYAGVHRNGHTVAIKILHERFTADPEIERLFRREAQLANNVAHPGVVPVIDDDVTQDGCVFLVMPLLQGETLRARAQRLGKKLPAGEVVAVAHAVLGVLGAAHAKKIVHRDIKPENLFVTCDGEIRVLDFGIGRFFETNESASATKSGRAVGTPAFMAPEQALGRTREVDGRTDLWALGATMFTLLSGRLVHEALSPTEIAVLAATAPARPLSEVAADVPEAIREVVDRALAFKKEDRWECAGAMGQALRGACVRAAAEVSPTVLVAPHTQQAAGLRIEKSPPDESSASGTHEDHQPGATEMLGATTTRTATGLVARDAPGVRKGRALGWAAFGAAVLTTLLGAGFERARLRSAPSVEATLKSVGTEPVPNLPAAGLWVVRISDGAIVSVSRAAQTTCPPASTTESLTATATDGVHVVPDQ